jgi:hypothetical protein
MQNTDSKVLAKAYRYQSVPDGGKQSFFNRAVAVAVCGLVVLTIVLGYFSFSKMWEDDLIIPGQGVTEIRWLSDYFPPLKGTLGDSRVFFLDSGQPGATVALLGGIHPDEHAGWFAALVYVERAIPREGRLIVIPQANNSAFTHSFPQEATPQFIHLKDAEGGIRKFRGGARGTNSINFWPDPEVFTHFFTGQKLAGEEVRNINRAFPGRPNGTFTEQMAYAITRIIIQENVNLVIDLHEGWPEYPFNMAIGVNQNTDDIGTAAVLDLNIMGVEMRMEMAPENFRGLTYRELPEVSGAKAALAETPNPGSGRLRGITSEKLIIEGIDVFYVRAAQLGRLFVPYDEDGWPLSRRVARHLATVQTLINVLSEFYPDTPVSMGNIPDYDEARGMPVGEMLNPVSMAASEQHS